MSVHGRRSSSFHPGNVSLLSTRERILEENWRLRFQGSTYEMELSALRMKIRYLEDGAAFLAEKIRLEDVFSELIGSLAAEAALRVETDRRLDALVEKSARMVLTWDEDLE